MQNRCPICDNGANVGPDAVDPIDVDCQTCGHFTLTATTSHQFGNSTPTTTERAAVSRWLRRASASGRRPHLDEVTLADVRKIPLPDAVTQADELLLLLASSSRATGLKAELSGRKALGCLGLIEMSGLAILVQHLVDEGFLRTMPTDLSLIKAQLTVSGWSRVRDLGIAPTDSRLIFMAMQFRNEPLRDLVDNHFKPAAEAAGFELRRVDEEPRAGLIDDLIRVDIRNSALVVADLSDGNHGALWESGFAEGVGKPVVYTCEAGVFGQRHFDVQHAQTIKWETGKFEEAAKQLKATIRATLPHLAKMTD